MSKPLTAWIEGIGFLAPGMPDWPTARAILRGETPLTAAPSVLPAPSILPPAERRRASRVVKLTLAIGLEAAAHAGADVATLATVFSASGAGGHNCQALCEQLATAMAPCQVICAYDASFGAGLIDALGQVVLDRQPTLLIAYDSEYPEPLFAKRPVPDVAGVALLLTPERSERSLASISVTPASAAAEPLADAVLESLRLSIPALRALPLLQKLARGEAGKVCLDYLPPMQLQVDIGLC